MEPRIALLGFSIECNRFAPVATEADFSTRTLLSGQAMLDEARSAAPRMLGELPGFVAAMDAAGPWQPVPIVLAMAEPNGPVDQAFFDRLMAQWEAGLCAAGKLDGVYCVLHGAGLTTADHDPEGTLLALVRRIAGDSVPVVATYDLHANVSDADVALVDAFIGYRTNPHLDMRERGAEAAQTLHRLLSGTATHLARIRLPIVPPTVTQLTGKDAPNRPYGELIDLGQQRMTEPPYAGRVLNVSVMGGFAYADTPFNGLTVVVTATDQQAADALAREVAEAGWARRERFRPRLTSLEEATRLAVATGGTKNAPPPPNLGSLRGPSPQGEGEHPHFPHALAFADVADNPGGGGRGNTMWILEAFHKAGVRDALIGVIHDPALAAEAHQHGEGARFVARFNRDDGDEFSHPFAAPATVRCLRAGSVRGRRGIYADNTLELGPSAALDLDGITVVVLSNRYQCADPVFFEAFGLDIAAARVVVVKSRGHFRGGFDEFFRHEDIVEVDAPGLTSPILSRFAWRHMPRPVLPIDDNAHWTATWTPPA
ncbi:MAG TPA: M81 family metallopeptidase [Acetobacteraceae bacterium]|nr:M81 family metallopeptidase [Acetobacteraceae bacterium]